MHRLCFGVLSRGAILSHGWSRNQFCSAWKTHTHTYIILHILTLQSSWLNLCRELDFFVSQGFCQDHESSTNRFSQGEFYNSIWNPKETYVDIDRFCNTQLDDFYEPFVLTRKLQITACNGVSIEDSYLQILFPCWTAGLLGQAFTVATLA